MKTIALVIASLAVVASAMAGPPKQGKLLDEVVHVRYQHGVPYEDARALGASAVGALVRELHQRESSPWWPNVVTALGYIGDSGSTQELIAFVERGADGQLSGPALDAVLAVPSALGQIAGNGDEKALKYLIEGSEIEKWTGTKRNWTASSLSEKQICVVLTTRCIMGLGIAGRAESTRVLEKMLKRNSSADYHATINEAIRLAQRIREEGRSKVFAQEKNER